MTAFDSGDEKDSAESQTMLSHLPSSDGMINSQPIQRTVSNSKRDSVKKDTHITLNSPNSLMTFLKRGKPGLDISSNNLIHVEINGVEKSFEYKKKDDVVRCFIENNVKTLERLTISKNKLLTVFPKIQSLDNLKFLNLSHNSIVYIPSSLHLRGLVELNLSSNKISEISPNIKLFKNSLTDLDLSFNQLVTLPNELYDLVKLKKLSLNNNSLEEISYENIIKLENLNTNGYRNGLNLRHNCLTNPPQKDADGGILSIKNFYAVDPSKNPRREFKLYVLGHDGESLLNIHILMENVI